MAVSMAIESSMAGDCIPGQHCNLTCWHQRVSPDSDVCFLQVLIGWSERTIVISFRGTASLRNAIADLQVMSHPLQLC
jgi:hypothetical protein